MKCKSYDFFSVVGNKTRWKIIKALYKQEMTVSQICEALEEEQSKVEAKEELDKASKNLRKESAIEEQGLKTILYFSLYKLTI